MNVLYIYGGLTVCVFQGGILVLTLFDWHAGSYNRIILALCFREEFWF